MPDNNGNNQNNNDDDEYEKYCYLCRRPESEAGPIYPDAGKYVYLQRLYAEKFRLLQQRSDAVFRPLQDAEYQHVAVHAI